MAYLNFSHCLPYYRRIEVTFDYVFATCIWRKHTTYGMECVQGIVFDRFLELDYEEVFMRKARVIVSKPELSELLQKENPADTSAAPQGQIISAQYTLYPCDIRELAQVCSIPLRDGNDAMRLPTC
jgi:hypothetical protein